MFFLFAGDNRCPESASNQPKASFENEAKAVTALNDATNYKGQHDWAYVSTDVEGKEIVMSSMRRSLA